MTVDDVETLPDDVATRRLCVTAEALKRYSVVRATHSRNATLPKALQHGSFTGSDLASQNNKPFTAAHTVDEVSQRFLMLRAAVQKFRIGA